MALADAGRGRAWTVAAREALGLDLAELDARGALIDRLGGIALALYEAGARPLIGTDCGNPFVIAGPSFHKELAELSRAGLPWSALLTAATTEARVAMRLPAATDDVVLYRSAPSTAADLARPDAVLVDGVLLDTDDLDRLWELRLVAAGLDARSWPRGALTRFRRATGEGEN